MSRISQAFKRSGHKDAPGAASSGPDAIFSAYAPRNHRDGHAGACVDSRIRAPWACVANGAVLGVRIFHLCRLR